MLTERRAWKLALVAGAGDVVTTLIGIGVLGHSEQNPILDALIGAIGLVPALLATKILALLIAYPVYRFVSDEAKMGVPLGIAVAWGAAFTLNLIALLP